MQAELKGKLKKLAEQNIVEGESIESAILGTPKQAIVALQDRLLIIKHGFRAAAVFGGKVASIDYRDVTGVEVKENMGHRHNRDKLLGLSGQRRDWLLARQPVLKSSRS